MRTKRYIDPLLNKPTNPYEPVITPTIDKKLDISWLKAEIKRVNQVLRETHNPREFKQNKKAFRTIGKEITKMGNTIARWKQNYLKEDKGVNLPIKRIGNKRIANICVHEFARDIHIAAKIPLPEHLKLKLLYTNHTRKTFRRNKHGKVY